MASAQGAWPAVLLLSALFLVPPAVSLAAGLRRIAALRRNGAGIGPWLPAAVAFSAGAIAVNLAVIAATLRRNDGNVKETAAVLGIDRSTLYDKLKRYGIER